MTRRLTLTIGAVVVATLLFVGVGTLAVAAVRSRAVTTSELRDQARELADGIGASLTAGLDPSASEADTAQAVRRRFGMVRRFATVMGIGQRSSPSGHRATPSGQQPFARGNRPSAFSGTYTADTARCFCSSVRYCAMA